MIHKIKVTLTKTINVAGISPEQAVKNTVKHIYRPKFSLSSTNANSYTIQHIETALPDGESVTSEHPIIKYGQFDNNIELE